MNEKLKYKLQDLIDIEQFQTLQDRLNEIYSFPSSIIDNDGNILTATAWQDVCTKFHRMNPECEKECKKSDRYILSHLAEANPAVSYRCPHGLVDNATPIIIDGEHYGNFFTGQFFLEPPDLEFFRGQARRYGFEEEAYLEAVQRVPVWSQKQLESYLFFIKGLIEVISSSGLKGLKEIEARKQSEEMDKRAGAILSQMMDGFWITNLMDGKVLDVNEAMCRMLGYTRDELLGMRVADVEAVDTEKEIKRRIRQVVRDGAAHFESRFRRKDGSVFDVEVSTNYLPSMDLIFGFHRDITERKRADEQLQVLKRSIDVAPDGAYWMDQNGRFRYANEAGCRVLGYTIDELLQLHVFDVNPRATPERWQQVWQGLKEHGSITMESVHRRKDGSEFPVELTSTYIQLGELEYCNGFAKDITERKRREHEMQAIAALSAAMRTAPTRAEMLPVIMEQAVDMLECDSVAIEMIEPQTGGAVVEAAYGSWKSLVGLRQEYGTGLNSIITWTRQPYVAENIKQEPRLTCPSWVRRGIRGCAGAPLIAQGQLIGFIWMGRRTKIAESEVELLAAVANIAANAIHRATLHEQTQNDAAELALAYNITLEGWARALELRDQETVGHTRRVVERTLDLARSMGIDEDALENIRRGALLHDIGKMGIPDSVLLKPGTLNEREWEIMKRHPDHAFHLLKQINYLRCALDIPYCHHEKWDGTGYPRGLKGEEIPLPARIFAVVDVWDALTNDRPYRLAWSEEDAMKYIRQQSGMHFDPAVVEAFFETMKKIGV